MGSKAKVLAASTISPGAGLKTYSNERKKEEKANFVRNQLILQQKGELEEENRRLQKEEEIGKRKKTSGLASLMGGSEEDSLG